MRGVWAGAGIRLLGFGHYYPATVQPNPPEVAAEVGVRSRYVASAAETVTAMAVRATEAALRAAGTSADELDLLVLANCTTRRYFPETAPQVATELGSARALAFDVCGGCAGWVHGVQLAAALLRTTPERAGRWSSPRNSSPAGGIRAVAARWSSVTPQAPSPWAGRPARRTDCSTPCCTRAGATPTPA